MLRAFPDEPLSSNDYEAAVAASNDCRAHGIAASASDAVICAVPVDRGWAIFTCDSDFAVMRKSCVSDSMAIDQTEPLSLRLKFG